MDIEFCGCGGMLAPAGKGLLRCRSCGKELEKKFHGKITAKSEKKEIVVIEDNAPDLPTTDKECPKCKHGKAYWWLIQTRSADEPPTQFFRCIKCRHVWREYK
ncbi:MAG: transcription factor S [Candidatus Aenigmarchaeota archaeon]|nr:transcription factor S [Candidatus Aenigmarchaeota archaeon]